MIGGLFLGSMALYISGRVLKKNVNYKAIEAGFFYILVAPIFMVVFDIPHLFVPPTYFLDRCVHISLIFTLILLPVLISFWIERFLKIKKRYTVLPAVLFPITIKYFPSLLGEFWLLVIGALSLTIFFSIKRMKTRAVIVFFLSLLGVYSHFYPF